MSAQNYILLYSAIGALVFVVTLRAFVQVILEDFREVQPDDIVIGVLISLMAGTCWPVAVASYLFYCVCRRVANIINARRS